MMVLLEASPNVSPEFRRVGMMIGVEVGFTVFATAFVGHRSKADIVVSKRESRP